MAYNYLGLVNDVCQRVGEVELTSSNFASTVGQYSLYKQAVNASIRHINQDEYEWPFNHSEQTDTLVAGTTRYAYPANTKRIDFDTFRVLRDATFGNETIKLKQINYEEYLNHFIDAEYNTSNTGIRDTPRYVARTPSEEYVVYPSPDEAYSLRYELYTLPTDLSAATDVPSLPEAFRFIIGDGAMYYVDYFREDLEAAERKLVHFNEKIDNMRKNYINRFYRATDRRVIQSYPNGSKYIKVS